MDRYNVNSTIKALTILGFNVRYADGATTIFCRHTITGKEVWIPKEKTGFLQDVLKIIFEPIKLEIEYFQSVYMNLKNTTLFPSDQN